jgi:hypothetical protein
MQLMRAPKICPTLSHKGKNPWQSAKIRVPNALSHSFASEKAKITDKDYRESVFSIWYPSIPFVSWNWNLTFGVGACYQKLNNRRRIYE